MKTYRYLIADVFTDRPFAGNPLGVFPEATGLSSDQMQRIAGELNLSETAFVLPPDGSGADFRLRIFTPRAELPFAGHPTVGTAVALAGIGAVTLRSGRADIVFAEEVGPIRVAIEQRANGGLFAQLATTGPFAQRECALDPAACAEMLSLRPEDLATGAPFFATAGYTVLVVPLRDADAVSRATLKLDVWARVTADASSKDIYVYAAYGREAAADLRVRHFAPALGILEDPATGGAAAALAACLAQRAPGASGEFRWRIDQGIEMGRPSRIEAEAEKRDGVVTVIRIGGNAVILAEGQMRVGAA